MANDYYDNSDAGQRFQPGVTARGSEVDGKFDAVQQGFAKLPAPAATGKGFADPIHVGSATADTHAVPLGQALDKVAEWVNASLYDPDMPYSFSDVVIGSDGITYRFVGDTPATGDDPVTSSTGNWSSYAGGGGGTLGEASASLSEGQQISIELSAEVETPIVSVTKEVVDTGLIEGAAEVATDGRNYEVENFAYDTSVTPSATSGSITLTLGAGSFQAAHVGLRVAGNGGSAVLTAADGSAQVETPFSSTAAISAGDWTMTGINFSSRGAELESIPAGLNDNRLATHNIAYSNPSYFKMTEMQNGNLFTVFQDFESSSLLRVNIYDKSGALLYGPISLFESEGAKGPTPVALGNGNIMLLFRRTNPTPASARVAIISPEGIVVNAPSDMLANSGDASNASATILPNGNVMVAYYDGSSLSNTVVLDENNATASSPTTFHSGYAGLSSLLVLSNGNVMIAYDDDSNASQGKVVVVDNQGVVVAGPKTITTNEVWAQDLALLNSGGVMLAYSDATADDMKIAIIDDVGDMMLSAVTVASHSTSALGAATLSSGDVLLVYRGSSASDLVGMAQVVAPDLQGVVGEHQFASHQVSEVSLLTSGVTGYVFCKNNTSGAGELYSITPQFSFPAVSPLSAITNANGQADSEFWAYLTSMSITDDASSHAIGYAWSIDEGGYVIAKPGQGIRPIARQNSGAWQYNADNSYSGATWVDADRQSAHGALSQACGNATNRMAASDVAGLSADDFPTLGKILNTAIIFIPLDDGIAPSSGGVTYTYDANAIHHLAIPGTDYEWDHPAPDVVRFRALTSMNAKVRVS